MKVLACGSRSWTEERPIERELYRLPLGTIIIVGGARGADDIIERIARRRGFEVRVYPADWATHGKAAGPIRNAEMLAKEHRLDEPIDLVLAFAKDFSLARGTSDMMSKARRKFIPVEAFSI